MSTELLNFGAEVSLIDEPHTKLTKTTLKNLNLIRNDNQWKKYGIQTQTGIEIEYLRAGGIDQIKKVFQIKRYEDFESIFRKINWNDQEEYRKWFIGQVELLLLSEREGERSSPSPLIIEVFKGYKSSAFNWISGEALNRTLFRFLRKNDYQSFIIDNILKNEIFFQRGDNVSSLLQRERDLINSVNIVLSKKSEIPESMIYFDTRSGVVRLSEHGFTTERSITISNQIVSNNYRTEELKNNSNTYSSSGRFTRNLGFDSIHWINSDDGVKTDFSIGNFLNSIDPIKNQVMNLEQKILSLPKLENNGDFFLKKFDTFKFVLECSDVTKYIRHFPKVPKNLRISEESSGFIRVKKEFKLKNSWKDYFSNCKIGKDGSIIPLEKLNPEDELRICFKSKKYEFIGRFPLVWNLINAPMGLIKEVFSLNEKSCPACFHCITKDHIVVLTDSEFDDLLISGRDKLTISQFRLEKIDAIFNTRSNFFPGLRDPQIRREKLKSALVVKPIISSFDHEILVLIIGSNDVVNIEKHYSVITSGIDHLSESFEKKLSLVPINESKKRLQISRLMNEESSDNFNILPNLESLSLSEKSDMVADDILSKHFFSRSSRVIILHWWIIGTFINLINESEEKSGGKNQQYLNSILSSNEIHSQEKIREISLDVLKMLSILKEIVIDYPHKLDISIFLNQFYSDNVLWIYFIQYKATDEEWKIFTNDLISFRSETESKSIRWIMDIVKIFREVYEKLLSRYAKRMEKAVVQLLDLPLNYAYPYILFPWRYSVKIISDALFTIELNKTYMTYDFITVSDSSNIEIATIELMKLIGLSIGFYRHRSDINLRIDVADRNVRLYFSRYLGNFTPEEILEFCFKNYLKYSLDFWHPNIFIASELLKVLDSERENDHKFLPSFGAPMGKDNDDDDEDDPEEEDEDDDDDESKQLKRMRAAKSKTVTLPQSMIERKNEELQQVKKTRTSTTSSSSVPSTSTLEGSPTISKKRGKEERKKKEKKTRELPAFEDAAVKYLEGGEEPSNVPKINDPNKIDKIEIYYQFSQPGDSVQRYLDIFKRFNDDVDIVHTSFESISTKTKFSYFFQEPEFNFCIFDKLNLFIETSGINPETTNFIEYGMNNSTLLCTISAMFNFRKSIGVMIGDDEKTKNLRIINEGIKNLLGKIKNLDEETKKMVPFLESIDPPQESFFDNTSKIDEKIEFIGVTEGFFNWAKYITEPSIILINSIGLKSLNNNNITTDSILKEILKYLNVKMIIYMEESGQGEKKIPEWKKDKTNELSVQMDLNYSCSIKPLSSEFLDKQGKWNIKVFVSNEYKSRISEQFKEYKAPQRAVTTEKRNITGIRKQLEKQLEDLEQGKRLKLTRPQRKTALTLIDEIENEEKYNLLREILIKLKIETDETKIKNLKDDDEEVRKEAISYFNLVLHESLDPPQKQQKKLSEAKDKLDESLKKASGESEEQLSVINTPKKIQRRKKKEKKEEVVEEQEEEEVTETETEKKKKEKKEKKKKRKEKKKEKKKKRKEEKRMRILEKEPTPEQLPQSSSPPFYVSRQGEEGEGEGGEGEKEPESRSPVFQPISPLHVSLPTETFVFSEPPIARKIELTKEHISKIQRSIRKDREQLLSTIISIGTCLQYSYQFISILFRIRSITRELNLKIRLVTGFDREIINIITSFESILKNKLGNSTIATFNTLIALLGPDIDSVISIDDLPSYIKDNVDHIHIFIGSIFDALPLKFEILNEETSVKLHLDIFQAFSMNILPKESELFDWNNLPIDETVGHALHINSDKFGYELKTILILPTGDQSYLVIKDDEIGRNEIEIMSPISSEKYFIQPVNYLEEGSSIEPSGLRVNLEERKLYSVKNRVDELAIKYKEWLGTLEPIIFEFDFISISEIFQSMPNIIFEGFKTSEVNKLQNANVNELKDSEEKLIERDKQFEKLKELVRKYQTDLSSQKEIYEKLQHDNDELQRKLKENVILNNQKSQELETARSILQLEKNRKRDLENTNAQLRTRLEELSLKNREEETNINNLQTELDKFERERFESQQQLNELEEKYRNIPTPKEIKEKIGKLKDLVQGKQYRINTLQRGLTNQQNANKELHENYKKLEMDYENKLKESKQKTELISRLDKEVENKAKIIEILEKNNEKLRNVSKTIGNIEKTSNNIQILSNQQGIGLNNFNKIAEKQVKKTRLISAKETLKPKKKKHGGSGIDPIPQTLLNQEAILLFEEVSSDPTSEDLVQNQPEEQDLTSDPESEFEEGSLIKKMKTEIIDEPQTPLSELPPLSSYQQEPRGTEEVPNQPIIHTSEQTVRQEPQVTEVPTDSIISTSDLPLTTMIHNLLATLPRFARETIEKLNGSVEDYIKNSSKTRSKLMSSILYVSTSMIKIIIELSPGHEKGGTIGALKNIWKNLAIMEPRLFPEVEVIRMQQSFFLLFYSVFFKIWLVDKKREESGKEKLVDKVFRLIQTEYYSTLNFVKSETLVPITLQREYSAITNVTKIFSGNQYGFGTYNHLKLANSLIVDATQGDVTLYSLSVASIKELESDLRSIRIDIKIESKEKGSKGLLSTVFYPLKRSAVFISEKYRNWTLSGSISNIADILNDYSKVFSSQVLNQKESDRSKETDVALKELISKFQKFQTNNPEVKFYLLGFLFHYLRTEGRKEAAYLVEFIGKELFKPQDIKDDEIDSLIILTNPNQTIQTQSLNNNNAIPVSPSLSISSESTTQPQRNVNDLNADALMKEVNHYISKYEQAIGGVGFQIKPNAPSSGKIDNINDLNYESTFEKIALFERNLPRITMIIKKGSSGLYEYSYKNKTNLSDEDQERIFKWTQSLRNKFNEVLAKSRK